MPKWISYINKHVPSVGVTLNVVRPNGNSCFAIDINTSATNPTRAAERGGGGGGGGPGGC